MREAGERASRAFIVAVWRSARAMRIREAAGRRDRQLAVGPSPRARRRGGTYLFRGSEVATVGCSVYAA